MSTARSRRLLFGTDMRNITVLPCFGSLGLDDHQRNVEYKYKDREERRERRDRDREERKGKRSEPRYREKIEINIPAVVKTP